MYMRRYLSVLSICFSIFALSLSGCSASLDKSKTRADEGATESTEIQVIQIPYNPDLPTYVFAIEPFIFRESLQQGQEVSQVLFQEIGSDLAAKLTSALSGVGNFQVIDSGLIKDSSGMYKAKMSPGEVGPFVVRATVTEFTEQAELKEKERKVSMGFFGLIATLFGAFTGSDALKYGGMAVAVANPEYQSKETERIGMVGLDFRVVDGTTGRIVNAFKSEGTFASVTASAEGSVFGIGGGETKTAQSVMEQAVTAALNDATMKIHDGMLETSSHASRQ
jgi:curli biogenesis system outer membrane secretion channel CsgG